MHLFCTYFNNSGSSPFQLPCAVCLGPGRDVKGEAPGVHHPALHVRWFQSWWGPPFSPLLLKTPSSPQCILLSNWRGFTLSHGFTHTDQKLVFFFPPKHHISTSKNFLLRLLAGENRPYYWQGKTDKIRNGSTFQQRYLLGSDETR